MLRIIWHKHKKMDVKRKLMMGCEEIQLPPDNEIWYTTTDGEPIEFSLGQTSNEYADGKGILTFGSPLTTIKDWTMRDFSTLKTFLAPSISKIGCFTFCNLTSLQTVVFSKSLTSGDPKGFFCNCPLLRQFNLGAITDLRDCFLKANSLVSVTGVENLAYVLGSWNFQNVMMRRMRLDSIVVIDDYFCSGCKKLEYVEFGSGLAKTGKYLCQNCPELKTVVFRGDTPPSASYGALPSDVSIYVPDDAVDAYKAADVWKKYAIKPLSEL